MNAKTITSEESFLIQSHALIECLIRLGEIEQDHEKSKWLEKNVFGETARVIKISEPNLSIFQGQGVLLTCLFLFLVIPYEWRNRKVKIELSGAERVALSQIELIEDNYTKKPASPLYHLRNALAHGRISWDNDRNKFVFLDENPKNSEERFSGRISNKGLGLLAQELNISIVDYIKRIGDR